LKKRKDRNMENSNKIRFWSVVPGIEDIAPIIPAKKLPVPDWWKKTPAHASGSTEQLPQEFYDKHRPDRITNLVESMLGPKPDDRHLRTVDPNEDEKTRSTGTIKLCPAIHDWFESGYVLPMWCDLQIELFEDGRLGQSGRKPYNFSTPHPRFDGGLMDNITYINWLPEEQQKRGAVGFINLECPWRMMTPPGISCFQFPMYYHFNQDFEVPPGPIWTDEYAQVNPQIIIKRYGQIKIPQGTPLCVFVPYDRSTVDNMELEIMSTDKSGNVIDEDCKRLEAKTDVMVQTVYKGGYRKMQKQGCPFPHDNKNT
jgi:hypothetical protein